MLVDKENLENLIREQNYDKVEELMMRGFYTNIDFKDIGYCPLCFAPLISSKMKCPNNCELG